jgi:hypothetical protein
MTAFLMSLISMMIAAVMVFLNLVWWWQDATAKLKLKRIRIRAR